MSIGNLDLTYQFNDIRGTYCSIQLESHALFEKFPQNNPSKKSSYIWLPNFAFFPPYHLFSSHSLYFLKSYGIRNFIKLCDNFRLHGPDRAPEGRRGFRNRVTAK